MVTTAIGAYIKGKGISITRISEATGINYQSLCNCFDPNKTRELRGDELLLVCRFLEVDPYMFMRADEFAEEREELNHESTEH